MSTPAVRTNVPIQAFIADKHGFFSLHSVANKNNLSATKQLARRHNYRFLATQQALIDQEIKQLVNLLDHQALDSSQHRLYAYYCCMLLSTHYDDNMYSDPDKKRYYNDLAQRLTGKLDPNCNRIDYASPTWYGILYTDLLACLSIPAHTSKLIGWLSAANVYRIALTFARIIVQQSLLVMRENEWLLHLSAVAIHLDGMNNRLNQLAEVLRPLSVLFFLARLILHLGVIAKHVLFPSAQEQQLPLIYRLQSEFKKNYAVLINDSVWTILNGLTNYSNFFQLSIPIVNTLVMIGFITDMALIGYRMHVANQAFLNKKKQYELEKIALQQQLDRHDPLSPDSLRLQQLVHSTDKQLTELALNGRVMQATLTANLIAASLITMGFSIPVFISSSVLILFSYSLTLIGIALYLSADAYGVYHEKTLRARSLNKPTAAIQQERQQAWNTFAQSMLLNTSIPLVIIGILALSWQAALATILVTLIYAYSTRFKAAAQPQPTLDSQAAGELSPSPSRLR